MQSAFLGMPIEIVAVLQIILNPLLKTTNISEDIGF